MQLFAEMLAKQIYNKKSVSMKMYNYSQSKHIEAVGRQAYMNRRSPQSSTISCNNGGFPSSLSVRNRCLPVLLNMK